MAKMRLVVGLLLLLSLLAPTTTATANSDTVKWLEVNIPTEGKSGNWVLAQGSDVQHPTMAIDGTLYCHAHPSGTSYTLFKSTDGGLSWSDTGKVTDNIVDIATAPDDASIIYYATASDAGVYSDWTTGMFTTASEAVAPVEKYTCPVCGLVFSSQEALAEHWTKYHAPAPAAPAAPTIPSWMLLTIIIIGAVLLIAVIVLIVRTRRVA